jgi:trehalose-6-phosphatase
MLYLLSEEGIAALKSFIDRKTLFAFDLDGTLAPIVANPEDIRALSAIETLVPKPRRITGKCVENLIPEGCLHKGDALLCLMKHAGCHKGFFIGDDVTDEDVFSLDEEHVFTTRIGYSSRSRAKNYLRRLNEVQRVIDFLVSHLNKRKP